MSRRSFAGVFLVLSIAAAQGREPKQRPDVPYLPTAPAVVEAMLRLANVRPGDLVYDLGCGDGRIVIAAARQFGARGVGVDIDPARIAQAAANAKKEGVGRMVKFEENDLFDAEIGKATVVALYLLPDVNLRLRPKLLKELKPGTRVVSHTFDMGDWKPEKEEIVDGSTIHLWVIPERK
jgi:SAM-dependent methyltransferase